jgi:hypothetical protein
LWIERTGRDEADVEPRLNLGEIDRGAGGGYSSRSGLEKRPAHFNNWIADE